MIETSDNNWWSIDSQPLTRTVRALLIGMVALSVLTMPVAAQTTSDPVGGSGTAGGNVCNTQLESMIVGFSRVAMGLGVLVGIAAYQANQLMGLFPVSERRRKNLEAHRRRAMSGALAIVLAPWVFKLFVTAMALPIASCLNIVP